jgi:hypothetical protein
MSRSRKGQKGPGYEYWGRRANGEGKWLRDPGRATKTQTHRRERRAGKVVED